jgi:PD-(D/E)XK nuclease superfamily
MNLHSSQITREVIGAAIEVHRALGPGLLESAYQQCLGRELAVRGIAFQREAWIGIEYKGLTIPRAYRLDTKGRYPQEGAQSRRVILAVISARSLRPRRLCGEVWIVDC